MRVELSDNQRQYIRSLLRMNIKKRRRELAKFQPFPGQSEEDFEDSFQRARDNLWFREATYAQLAVAGESKVVPE